MQTTTSGIVVAPFVGVIASDTPLRPQLSEVAQIFDVPLSALRDPKFRGDYEWKTEGPATRSSKFPAILYGGQTIWGLTLRITLNLLELLESWSFRARRPNLARADHVGTSHAARLVARSAR